MLVLLRKLMSYLLATLLRFVIVFRKVDAHQ